MLIQVVTNHYQSLSDLNINQNNTATTPVVLSVDSLEQDSSNISKLVDPKTDDFVTTELQTKIKDGKILESDNPNVNSNINTESYAEPENKSNLAHDEFELPCRQEISYKTTDSLHDSQLVENSVTSQAEDKSIVHEDFDRKRRRSKSSDISSPNNDLPPRKKRKSISNSLPTKKDKLYCICQTKYDSSKFYVGCDVCNEWFHGDCVGISEENSKNVDEFVCQGCSKASDNHEIFCLCQEPYDNTQTYIGCDGCPDWFHGRCVGILEKETQKINQYFCPRCAPDSAFNRPNFKTLKEEDLDLVKKLIKQLLGNRYAAPFKEPVNQALVPNYYNVIKEPMDLQTIDQRVGQKYYTTLCKFIGDVMRIFENCRIFNPENSLITKNADNLESYFIQKLAVLREKVAAS